MVGIRLLSLWLAVFGSTLIFVLHCILNFFCPTLYPKFWHTAALSFKLNSVRIPS